MSASGAKAVLPRPERPVIDCFADVAGLNPLRTIQIRNRSGNGNDAIADIGIDAEFNAGALEEIGRILV